MNEYETMVEWYSQGKTELLREKLVPVPIRPPQILHELARDRTRVSATNILSHGPAHYSYDSA